MTVPDALVASVVAGSHTARIEARAVTGLQTGADPDGDELTVAGGDVAFDAGADVFATAEATVAGAWPSRARPLLAPDGRTEVFLRRGIDLGASGTLWCGLGYFRILDVDQENAPGGGLRLTCEDRMSALVDARFLTPRVISKGRTVGSVVRDLVDEVLPGVEVVFDDAAEFATLARDVIVERDRYQFLADLAEAQGKVVHFDGEGRLQFRTPDPAQQPRWHIGAGAGGVLIKADRSLSRRPVRNAVVARGEGAGESEPALGIAIDADPRSATYFYGPFGQVPQFYNSPLLADDDQAVAAATTILSGLLGLPHTANLTAVCNPAVRPWDPVRVTTSDGERHDHVLRTVTVPLAVEDPLRATTVEQTHVTIRSLTP